MKGLSLSQIGKMFGCEGTNILYWMKKLGVKRRPADYRKIPVPKANLRKLYWRRGLKPREIAKIYGIKNERTVRKKMEKHDIPRKTVSEALTTKFRATFSGDLTEKSYFLGLRAGDFYSRKKDRSVRFQTTTTHLAQIELLTRAFSKYGEICTYLSRNKERSDEWFIYVDLNDSFEFLVKKPTRIPKWIMDNDQMFLQFLTAYMDCEGCWRVAKSHKNSVRFFFDISTQDKAIIHQIKDRLKSLGYTAYTYLDKRKGDGRSFGRYNKDIYNVIINRKRDIILLIDSLLHLSKHTEKIRKMKFIQRNHMSNWDEIEPDWIRLREDIKKELQERKNYLQ